MHRSRPGQGGRPGHRAHGAGASVGGWSRRRSRRRGEQRGPRPAAGEQRRRGGDLGDRLGGRSRLGGRHLERCRRSLVGRGGHAAVGGRGALARRAGRTRGDPPTPGGGGRLVHCGLSAAVPSPFSWSPRGVGSESWGAGPPAWRSLIAAIEVALAHLRGVRDVQLTRELAQLREHHRAQAPAAAGAAVPPGVSGAPASGAVPVVTRSVSLTKVLPDRPGTFPGQRITCSIRTVCRTTVGLSAASAAVPNGQDDDRRGSGEGPLGRFAGSDFVLARLEWPRGLRGSPLRHRG